MHPDAVMTYEDALITVHHFPAGLYWARRATLRPSASPASVLNLNVCNSTLFHDPRMHRGD
jgi:hypothetical protein